MKVKINLDSDEMYPVYYIAETMSGYTPGIEVEVNKSTKKRWNRIWREFHEMQREMKVLSEDAYEKYARKT